MKSVFAALVVVLLMLAATPSASAACEYGVQRHIRQHMGSIYNGVAYCPTVAGPTVPFPDVIGEEIRDCDNSLSSWGITSCGIDIVNDIYEDCPPICDDPMAANDRRDDAQPAPALAASCVLR
ncbi:MAG: hypothetical protein JO197_07045 [Acidobacteria bacterium]|nr:hypothetical protein [Acidobacteriota bacterium]MBV9477610.1 hypothetical protein [Acidobacteriota bacterium]